MNLTQSLQDLVNQPPPAALVAALGASALLLLFGCAVLLVGRRRIPAAAIVVIGLVLGLLALYMVDQQTISYRESPSVIVTRPRYREGTRTLARSGMIALPGAVALVVLGALASARRRLRRSVPAIVKAGRMHLLLREYEPALAQFDRAIRIAPFLAEAHCGRGSAFEGLGKPDAALTEYDLAIQSDPRSAHAYIGRARLRAAAGDLDGALADLGRVLDLQPTDPEVYLNRGICFFKKGHPTEAAADFHRVLKLTNHTDFAEPAKDYLRRISDPSAFAPLPSAAPTHPQANGATDSTVLPEPKAEDYIL